MKEQYKYILWRDGIKAEFNFLKEVSAYVDVTPQTIIHDYLKGFKRKGWSISRVMGAFPMRSAGLRANHLLTPNKTEREYYAYQKGAKA